MSQNLETPDTAANPETPDIDRLERLLRLVATSLALAAAWAFAALTVS